MFYYKIIGFTVFITVLFFSGCDKQINQDAGFLEGNISIGPICPVETDPPQPGCMPTAETYKAYPVCVYTSDGHAKVACINPSLDGTFNIVLPIGTYVVDREEGIIKIGSSNLPVVVEIFPGVKTILNVDIDTGIR